jgi:NitT/TauT family transport system ATP-binding protein
LAVTNANEDRPLIVFNAVTKTFPDGTEAVRDISLSVHRREFVAVVGPSGCGKSTLLRMASELTPLSSGTITRAVENIGFVFQDATLLPWRTVQRNVELFPQLHGIEKTERRRLAAEALELVGLTAFNNHYPKALSGGMKMRVSLARSLTMRPPLFLFDEPFGALDELTRQRLNEELLTLFIDEGFGAIFITHSISEAVFLSTRVLVMSPRPGRLIGSFDVPFGYPRLHDLRFDPEFAELSGQVSASLSHS